MGTCASPAGGLCSIPGQGTKIPHDIQCSQKKKKLQGYIVQHREYSLSFIKTINGA